MIIVGLEQSLPLSSLLLSLLSWHLQDARKQGSIHGLNCGMNMLVGKIAEKQEQLSLSKAEQ